MCNFLINTHNRESTVRLGDSEFALRNPPHFMSFSEATLRDAEYETEAVIDAAFFHPNTAPFVATRLIQRRCATACVGRPINMPALP